MDNEDPNEIIDELDIVIKQPKHELYVFQYPLRPESIGWTNFEKIEELRMKPLQKKFDLNISINSTCENFPKNDKKQGYTMSSKLIKNRTNYCLAKLEHNKLILIPITDAIQMRKSFEDVNDRFKANKSATSVGVGDGIESDNTKISTIKEDAKGQDEIKINEEVHAANIQLQKRENIKLIERRLRTFRFQDDVMRCEDFIKMKYYDISSIESKRFLHALVDLPRDMHKLSYISKGEYLKYLF